MENAKDIGAPELKEVPFDGVEIVGLVVPLLFAIMAIVLVAFTPDSSGTASVDAKTASERAELIEPIQRR